MKKLFAFIMVVASIGVVAQTKQTDEWMLFYLGGQSNMVGYGKVDELPEELEKGYDNIYIFNGKTVTDGVTGGGTGEWEELRPGFGEDFADNGGSERHGARFGVELSLGKRLREMFPGKKIALIKYARGGSKLDTIGGPSNFGIWAPGIYGSKTPNQTNIFISTVNNSMQVKDINNDGIEDRLIPCGIFWMQGESDAADKQMALNYEDNLNTMMCIIRGVFRNMDLPVVIGKISDSGKGRRGNQVWAHGDLVMYAQEQYVQKDPNARIIRNTSKYSYSDPYHYDSEGYIDMGIQFANEFYMLHNKLLTKRRIPEVKFLKNRTNY